MKLPPKLYLLVQLDSACCAVLDPISLFSTTSIVTGSVVRYISSAFTVYQEWQAPGFSLAVHEDQECSWLLDVLGLWRVFSERNGAFVVY